MKIKLNKDRTSGGLIFKKHTTVCDLLKHISFYGNYGWYKTHIILGDTFVSIKQWNKIFNLNLF